MPAFLATSDQVMVTDSDEYVDERGLAEWVARFPSKWRRHGIYQRG